MARDHALAACMEPGSGVVRLYRWERPTVSFGRNEPAADRYDAEAGGRAGVDFVRRPTGGRAVLHDVELTYSVVVPLRSVSGLRPAYRRINRALVEGLRTLGAPVETAGEDAPVLGPGAGPCFRAPAAGEVVGEGGKLVGSAQVRIGEALLQHGSILVDGDQGLLWRLRREEDGAEPSDPGSVSSVTLRRLLGERPDWDEVVAAVSGGFRTVLGGSWRSGALSVPELEAEESLRAERYGADAWTWRR